MQGHVVQSPVTQLQIRVLTLDTDISLIEVYSRYSPAPSFEYMLHYYQFTCLLDYQCTFLYIQSGRELGGLQAVLMSQALEMKIRGRRRLYMGIVNICLRWEGALTESA